MSARIPGGALLPALEDHDGFIARHIGTSTGDQQAMLDTLGFPTRGALIDAIVPAAIRLRDALPLPGPRSEAEALAMLRGIASRNRVLKSFIGQGYYGTHTPGVILRNVFENPAWYTAYTPYQPEISQGRLEALLNFQTMVCDLTGMEIANASMLDEATSAAESMNLLRRVSNSTSRNFFVADDVLPQTLEVIRTRADPLGIEVVTGPAMKATGSQAFGVLLQYPGVDGRLRDYRELVAAMHAQGALVAVATDLLALTILVPPGEWGADVVVGSSQRFGVPMGYGGPHAAFMATRDAFKRALPGRLVGVSVDAAGRPAYRLALQTREQHIRREKATSNICTAQVLLAVIASMYAVYHGAEGLLKIARRVHRLAVVLKAGLARLGFGAIEAEVFDTLTLSTGAATAQIIERALAAGLNLRQAGAGMVGIALDETTTRADVAELWRVFGAADAVLDVDAIDAATPDAIPRVLTRRSAFLTHPVFRRHRSETQMLHYLRSLADKDLALDRSMIPLGSCTMKLNATSEMLPVTWPEFAQMHPFVPAEQALGYAALCTSLEAMLCAVTGYDAVIAAAQRGIAGRVCGPADDPGLSRKPRRGSSRRMPDPGLGAWHQPRVRPDGGDDSGGRRLRPRRECRSRGPRSEGACASRRSGRDHGHLPVDAWRVRDRHRAHLRDHSRLWRPGVCRRREPECAGRPRRAGSLWRGRVAPQSPQDVLHPPRRRRSRGRPGRLPGAPRSGSSRGIASGPRA